jgi:hypothetical protein
MYDLRQRNVRFLVNLRIELDVPIGGFASPSDTGIWLLSAPRPRIRPSLESRVEDPMRSSGWFRVGSCAVMIGFGICRRRLLGPQRSENM